MSVVSRTEISISVKVEGVGVIFEEVEGFGVVRMIVGVNGSNVVDGTDNVIVLVLVVRNVVSREHKHIPSC